MCFLCITVLNFTHKVKYMSSLNNEKHESCTSAVSNSLMVLYTLHANGRVPVQLDSTLKWVPVKYNKSLGSSYPTHAAGLMDQTRVEGGSLVSPPDTGSREARETARSALITMEAWQWCDLLCGVICKNILEIIRRHSERTTILCCGGNSPSIIARQIVSSVRAGRSTEEDLI